MTRPLAALAFACSLAAASPAHGDLISPTVSGSVTVGGGGNLFLPPTDNVPITAGEEFRGEVFRNTIFGTNSADAFADLDTDGITLGFERTAGSSGIATESPVEFTFTGLEFDRPLTGLSRSFPEGVFGREINTAFTQTSVTVTLPDGFFLDSGEPTQSLRLAFETAAVPEPSTCALLLAGAGALALRRRRG